MAERPIIFSGEEVRAILEGRKTQTRRLVKPQPKFIPADAPNADVMNALMRSTMKKPCKPGDLLWVKETWSRRWDNEQDGFAYNDEGNLDPSCVYYQASGDDPVAVDGDGFRRYRKNGEWASPWSPSIRMPRWASRLTLLVKSVRVERLQDISHEDAMSEGCMDTGAGFSFDMARFGESDYAETAFAHLWDSINGKKAPWESNPWVWVIEFEVSK